MDQDVFPSTLQRIPWFRELNPHQLDSLARITSLRHLDQGEVLFCEGDSEDCMYVILEGEVQVEAHVPGKGSLQIYTADPLDIIGWSVLTPVIRQRTATVRALSTTHLVCFKSDLLRQLCEEDHDFGYTIMRRVANVVASRMLSTRLRLIELINQPGD